MKHRFFAITAAIAATFCVSLGLVGCKPETPIESEPHEHNFDDGWHTDGEKHWLECPICHIKLNEGEHTFDDVVGYGYPAYAGENAAKPILHVTAPEGKTGEIYIKEVWACLEKKEGASLRVAYSTTEGGTFASGVDISASQGGWTKAVFPGDGLRLLTYSYFRLQAVEQGLTVREIIFLASDEEGNETYYLMNAVNVGEGNKGQEGERRKGLVDAQQFPGEKRACTVCDYPEPKTQE